MTAPDTLTLLISRHPLPEGWFEPIRQRLPALARVHLFFFDHGLFATGTDFSFLPPGERLHCAHSRRTLQAPTPAGRAGGLYDLGLLIRAGGWMVTLPRVIWPPSPPGPGPVRRVALHLEPPGPRQVEGLRLAAGLAGCDHQVTLLSAAPVPRGLDTDPYLEALHSLGARFAAPGDQPPVTAPEILLAL